MVEPKFESDSVTSKLAFFNNSNNANNNNNNTIIRNNNIIVMVEIIAWTYRVLCICQEAL